MNHVNNVDGLWTDVKWMSTVCATAAMLAHGLKMLAN